MHASRPTEHAKQKISLHFLSDDKGAIESVKNMDLEDESPLPGEGIDKPRGCEHVG